jgi:hypothetical protein
MKPPLKLVLLAASSEYNTMFVLYHLFQDFSVFHINCLSHWISQGRWVNSIVVQVGRALCSACDGSTMEVHWLESCMLFREAHWCIIILEAVNTSGCNNRLCIGQHRRCDDTTSTGMHSS